MDARDDRDEMRARARKNELRERAQNELLEKRLSALEGERAQGREESVFHEDEELLGLVEPGDLAELDELVRLAAAVRELPHPMPEPAQARARQQQVLAAASRPTRPIRNKQVKPAAPAWPAGAVRPSSWALRLSLVSLGVVLVLAVSLTGLGLYLAGPRGAQAAVLMDASGQVEAQGADGAWQAVENGDRIRSGQRLRAGTASHATLVFFDGTRTVLQPGSDVTLASVGGSWGHVLRVALTQHAGKTLSSVVPLRGSKSAFTVLTPSGAASVHGTTFDVAVDAVGRSRFGVTTGQVLVSNDASQVLLTAGQATAALPEGALETPSYQFNLHGTLSSREGSTWIVAGVPFTVTPETSLSGDLQIGAEVIVVGRVLESGEWIADSLELAPVDPGEAETASSFTGILESNDGDVWMVSSWTVKVDSSTELGEGLRVGAPVRVTLHTLEDGRWEALQIEALQETEETPVSTQDLEAQPVLSFRPEELKAKVCGTSQLTLSGALANTAAGVDNSAANVELAYQVVEGAGFVDWVELTPSKWERIEAGGAVNFNVSLATKGDWGSAGGQEIKLRVFVLNNPAGSGTRLTVKVENECAATEPPVETAAVTPSPEVTDTPDITATETVTPTVAATLPVTNTLPVTTTVPVTVTATPVITETVAQFTNCTGAQPHPTGMRLAVQYGVPYEEIMGWFCQGFGFGEIDMAYSLSLQSGKPVAEIFAMKSSGMGWGEIKKQLETGPGDPKDNGNPKKQNSPVSTAAPDHPGNGNPNGKPDKPDKPKPNKP